MINNVYCLFEQSGAFKNAFKDLGYNAIDLDIENKYGETDVVIDLFEEIRNAYDRKESIFDSINKDDLIVAFFPCTYFSIQNNLIWNKKFRWFKNWDKEKVDKYISDRLMKRSEFFSIFIRFMIVIERKGIPCIIENPYTGNYLLEYYKPQLVIQDRSKLGDNHKKPTMFYSLNFEFKNNDIEIINNDKEILLHNKFNGHLRSCIHTEFCNNFIRKYII